MRACALVAGSRAWLADPPRRIGWWAARFVDPALEAEFQRSARRGAVPRLALALGQVGPLAVGRDHARNL